jgi:hypothetical protein
MILEKLRIHTLLDFNSYYLHSNQDWKVLAERQTKSDQWNKTENQEKASQKYSQYVFWQKYKSNLKVCKVFVTMVLEQLNIYR